MNKALVVYFSASGVTRAEAKELARVKVADLFEILPRQPYTVADLNWTVQDCRSTVEMRDPDFRPEIAGRVKRFDTYQEIYLGFPIWWGREPNIIDTFVESYDFSGKRLIPFCTSEGSSIELAVERLRDLAGPEATVEDGRRLGAEETSAYLQTWEKGPGGTR